MRKSHALFVLCFCLLLAAPASAEKFSFADGTTVTAPSSFKRNDNGSDDGFAAWRHKKYSWTFEISNRSHGTGFVEKFYDAEKKQMEEEGAVISDTWVGGAEKGFKAEKKTVPQLVIYVVGPTRKTVILRFRNHKNEAPAGFEYVVKEVTKSFKLGR